MEWNFTNMGRKFLSFIWIKFSELTYFRGTQINLFLKTSTHYAYRAYLWVSYDSQS
jgi:hypothetical protein